MDNKEEIEKLFSDTSAPCVREGSHRARLKAELVDQMRRKDTKMSIFETNPRKKLGWAFVVAALVIVGILAGISPRLGGTTLAFGQVVERIHQIQTMIYQHTYVPSPGEEGPPQIDRCFYKAPYLWRQEWVASGVVLIDNSETHKMLQYFPKTKTYYYNENDQPGYASNILHRIAEIQEAAIESLPEKELDGHKVVGFKGPVPIHDGSMRTLMTTIWADAKTGNPVQVEFAHADGSRGVWSDFQFDKPLDDALFSLTPPEGYAREPMP